MWGTSPHPTFGKYYLSHPLLYSSAFMVSNRRMQWESLFGSREIYHPDLGKLDDCPLSIKPKYSIVLNIRDSDWVCSGKLSKEWNGGGCILFDTRLAEESTDELSEPSMSLLNNSHSPRKWNFSWNVYLPFAIRCLLYCFFKGIWSYHVFLSFFQFQKSGIFQNIRSGKNNKTNKQKNMVAIKAFECVAASEVNCSLERREESLMSPIWFS